MGDPQDQMFNNQLHFLDPNKYLPLPNQHQAITERTAQRLIFSLEALTAALQQNSHAMAQRGEELK